MDPTYKIVKQLCEGYDGEGMTIYMDRYYTRVQLVADLKQKQIGSCGTIMWNRLRLMKEQEKKIQDLKERENQYMGSVDLFDQMASYHAIQLRSNRW